MDSETTTTSFQTAGYVLLEKLLPQPLCQFLYEYCLKSAAEGRLKMGDSGVPGTPCRYSDPFMEALLEVSLHRIEQASGCRLYPTYSYFRIYKEGDVLGRHTDRSSCEVSLTACLGYDADSPWPIWVEANEIRNRFVLEAGDALLYRGITLPHWRDRFVGTHAAQVFLHYVEQDGPYSDFRYDKRSELNTSVPIRQFLEKLAKVGGD